jgi:hypothetical protein
MINYRKIRVSAGEVSALVAQILGAHYPAGINQERLEREVMAALEDCKARLGKLRSQITPPDAREGGK